MKKKILLALSLCSLTLTSCSKYHGKYAMLINGDTFINETNETWENLIIEAKTLQISNIIESHESFIYLLTSSTCPACQEVRSYLESYIKNSNHSVFVEEDSAHVYRELADKYPLLFVQSNTLFTPTILIVKDGIKSTYLLDSRISTGLAFNNVIKKTFYETNIYTFRHYENIQKYLNKYSEATIIYFDRANNTARQIYKDKIQKVAQKAKSNITLVELDSMGDVDKNKLKIEHNLPDNVALFARRIENKEVIAEADFSNSISQSEDEFISKYII